MIRFRNFPPLIVTALVVVAVASIASPAHASFDVSLQETGFTTGSAIFNGTGLTAGGAGQAGTGTVTSTSSILLNGREQISINSFLFGGYQITVTATTNTPGGNVPGSGTVALQTANTITVTNLSASTNPLTIDVFSDGFNIFSAGTQVNIVNSISSTELDPNSPTDSSASAVSLLNGGSPTLAAKLSGSAAITSSAPGSASTNESLILGTSPFSIDSKLTISNLALGATANVTWTTIVSAPAPAGLRLALSGLALLTLGFCLKRRQVRFQATA
jgi:hypothetical protein